jgi:hypothetical protein
MTQIVIPLDPNSDHGREVTERLGDILASIRLDIDTRDAVAVIRARSAAPVAAGTVDYCEEVAA